MFQQNGSKDFNNKTKGLEGWISELTFLNDCLLCVSRQRDSLPKIENPVIIYSPLLYLILRNKMKVDYEL